MEEQKKGSKPYKLLHPVYTLDEGLELMDNGEGRTSLECKSLYLQQDLQQ